MQLTVTLTKDTPLEVMLETAEYITILAGILHNGAVPTTNFVTVADHPAPTFTDNVVPMRLTTPASAPAAAEPAHVESDPLEVDVDGYPWDKRIHAAGRGKTATGQWRKRRNTADEVVAQVEAELRNRLAARASRAPAEVTLPPLAVPAPAAGDVPLPPEPAILMPTPAVPAPPAAVPAPPAPVEATAVAAPAVTERSLDEVLALVTDVLVADLLVEEDVQRILSEFDLKELSDLSTKTPATVALVYNAIEGAAK